MAVPLLLPLSSPSYSPSRRLRDGNKPDMDEARKSNLNTANGAVQAGAGEGGKQPKTQLSDQNSFDSAACEKGMGVE